MRVVLLGLIAACSSTTTTKPARTAPPATPLANATHSCADAALGLSNATRGVRSPDHDVFDALNSRCMSDSWPIAAVDCFAVMNEGELGHCAKSLSDAMRQAVFAVLAGGETNQEGIMVARARLEQLQVGIPECDQFVSTVSTVLTCERMPIEDRLQLGNETAEFWALPTSRLGREDRHRMSEVCTESRTALQDHAVAAGCMP
jgi:hypothetical protein